ncbi:L-type lectin-domain containing protein [Actinoplanes palleronii]|nr:L-type lectin-domain containing protein [Actinoplanes palleronii]
MVPAPVAAGPDFEWVNFAPAATMHFNGSAAIAKAGPSRWPILRLTDGGRRQTGSAWLGERIDLTGSFDTTFEVLLHHGTAGAADIAFVLRADRPQRDRTLAVEFDDHVALVLTRDHRQPLATAEAPVPLFGAPFRARVVYRAIRHDLRVYLGGPGGEAEPHLVINRTVDLTDRLGAATAWIGFTGASGHRTAKQDILNWSLHT